MKREEQIEVATAAYINGRLRNNVPPEEIEEIRLAYQAGAIYADHNPVNYDGKAMLHVLNKGHKQGYKDAIKDACELLARMVWEVTYEDLDCNSTHHYDKIEFIEDFKKAMEEQQ